MITDNVGNYKITSTFLLIILSMLVAFAITFKIKNNVGWLISKIFNIIFLDLQINCSLKKTCAIAKNKHDCRL